MEGSARVLGPDHPDTADKMYNLAINLKQLGRLAEAAELYRGAEQVYLHVYGPEHSKTTMMMRMTMMMIGEEVEEQGA